MFSKKLFKYVKFDRLLIFVLSSEIICKWNSWNENFNFLMFSNVNFINVDKVCKRIAHELQNVK